MVLISIIPVCIKGRESVLLLVSFNMGDPQTVKGLSKVNIREISFCLGMFT